MLNIVTGDIGSGQAVLIRAARVVDGADIVRQRRKGRLDLIGPGKVGQALGLSVQDSGREMGDWFNIYPSQRTKKIQGVPEKSVPKVILDFGQKSARPPAIKGCSDFNTQKIKKI